MSSRLAGSGPVNHAFRRDVQLFMATLFFDLRDTLRALRRDLGYALTVVGTLALTIGAATAVFSIVDGVLLKPLAFRESQQLVGLKEIWRQLQDRIPTLPVNEQHFEYWRTHTRAFESMAQYIVLPANLIGAGDASQVEVGRASGSLFETLRVRAARGRALTPDDEPSSRPKVAVITDACWRQRFGSDQAILDRVVVLDGEPHTIVGVLPAGFSLPTERLASVAEVYVPIHMDASRVGWEGDHNDEAIGRLRAGVTIEQARAELDLLQQQVGEIAAKEAHEPVTLAAAVTPLAETMVGRARLGLLLLLGAIAAVLLIACSNLANLSLTRAVGRLRDSAIRSALGASRTRLVGHAIIEQVVLSISGGVLGLGVAWAALRLFVRTAPIDLPRVAEVSLDARVLAFTAAVSVAAGFAVAMLPAWRSSRRDVEHQLRAGALTTTSDRGGRRARGALLALQVALSLALLVVTTLLGASFWRLLNVDRGFEADRLLSVPISLPTTRYASEGVRVAVYDRLLGSVRAVAGVTNASLISVNPLSGSAQVNGIAPIESAAPRADNASANFRFVGPEFFRTMGIPILRGRTFTDAERPPAHTMPAVVSDRTAERLWPDQDPLGRRFSRGIPGEEPFEVVGIAADAKITSLERTPPLMVYLPYWWRSRATTNLLVKAAGDTSAVMGSVRAAIRQIDPEIAIGSARPMESLVDASVAARRYQMQLFVAFGLVALTIAAVGVYAVMSYGVSQRRREMNIRVALGARTDQVMTMVMAQGMAPVAVGIAAGTVIALGIGGLVASLLFDVRPRDPAAIAAVAVVVSIVAVISGFAASRRALSIDPASALREE